MHTHIKKEKNLVLIAYTFEKYRGWPYRITMLVFFNGAKRYINELKMDFKKIVMIVVLCIISKNHTVKGSQKYICIQCALRILWNHGIKSRTENLIFYMHNSK